VGEIKFNNDYLNRYMEMVEDTESPRIFHLWSAIFNLSSSLGRRCWLPFGPMNIWPNHFILIIGSPASRKSTAASIAKRALKSATGVRFAPADTGGQRQGLVLAMQGNPDDSREYLGAAELGAKGADILTLADLAEVTNIPPTEEHAFVDEADKHHIAVVASEFSRFIGQNNLQMMDFLVERWDGDDYEYKTRQSNIVLKNTLMNLLACTTPTMLNNSMPSAAGGQGFLSRMILVYGARKYRDIPRPSVPDQDLVLRVKDVLNDVYYNMAGAFDETKDGRAYSESLYGYTLEITDPRFAYYAERRYTHLLKLAMCLAAARKDRTIVRADYEEAHRILRATERGMPDALGEFGMNPLAMLKQEILEQLRANQGPVTMEQVVAMFHRDARTQEITEVINDLLKTKQVKMNQLPDGRRVLSAVFSWKDTEDEMLRLLSEN
jgi:hypothetical protein